jgi:hypothetical protein
MPKKIVYDKVQKLTKCPDGIMYDEIEPLKKPLNEVLKKKRLDAAIKYRKCDCCECQATNFHSRCCNAHFEGIFKDNAYYIACEKCGKLSGQVIPIKKR